MTVKELYEWAKQNNAENLDIEIQYRDGGGYYSGTDDCDPEICDREHPFDMEEMTEDIKNRIQPV